MQQFGNKRYEWLKVTPLENADDIIVPLAAGGGLVFAPTGGLLYLTWGVRSSLTFLFIVEGCPNTFFAAGETFILINQACLAIAYYTPFELPAPWTGGQIKITMPYVRIRLVDTAMADHATTCVYVQGWWE
ncbi:unnamed protein product, partial [marine sediment metagenome]